MATINLPDPLKEYLKPSDEPLPEAVHGEWVKPFNNNVEIDQAHRLLNETREELANLYAARNTPSPDDTPYNHAYKLKRYVNDTGQRVSQSWDKVKSDLKAGLSRVEGELEAAANLKPVPEHFNAIVGTFGMMDVGQKMAALDRLIELQDGPTLASILNAPLLVTGLEPETRDAMKAKMLNKVSPHGVGLRDALRNALARLETASVATVNTYAKLLEGTDRWDKKKAEADAIADRTYRTGSF